MPFYVENAVGRSARHRSENTAAVGPCAAPAQTQIGAQIMPQRKDGVVIRTLIRSDWQTAVIVETVWLVSAHEVESAIRVDVHVAVRGPIQHEWEWQANERVAVVTVVAGVGDAGDDRVRAVGDAVLVRRTALHGVITGESGIGIAGCVGNRPGAYAGRQAAPKRNAQDEARRHVVIDHRNGGDTSALNAAQRQVGPQN